MISVNQLDYEDFQIHLVFQNFDPKILSFLRRLPRKENPNTKAKLKFSKVHETVINSYGYHCRRPWANPKFDLIPISKSRGNNTIK